MIKLGNIFAKNQLFRFNLKRFATLIKMPSLSPTMSEGGIVEWHKKEGDKVSAGDLICDIQTDKAIVGMEAEEDGILAKIIKGKDSQNIVIGETIGVMADLDEDWKSVKIPDGIKGAAKAAPVQAEAAKSAESVKVSHKMGPAARRLLDTYGLSSGKIDASGPHDILTKSDVLQFIDKSKLTPAVASKTAAPSKPVRSAATPPQSDSQFVDVPVSEARLAVLTKLSQCKQQIPHFYTSETVSIDPILEIAKGSSLAVNDFVIKACSLALRLVPAVNSRVGPDGTVQTGGSVDVAVVVPTVAGTLTPVVFGADSLPLVTISTALQSLETRAHSGQLQPHELVGGSFTISNLGHLGVRQFTAVINAPQVAILAVGSGLPSVQLDQSGRPRLDTRMTFTLCADATVVDAATASLFVGHVKRYLENPRFLTTAGGEGGHSHAWTY